MFVAVGEGLIDRVVIAYNKIMKGVVPRRRRTFIIVRRVRHGGGVSLYRVIVYRAFIQSILRYSVQGTVIDSQFQRIVYKG